MCGIVGFLQCHRNLDYRQSLKEAINLLSHRGPDSSGIWTSKNHIGLGHRRLSILDLSSSGHQPMETEDKRYILVFNGEVYNFKEIREKLQNLGHKFKSNCDSEVILEAFIEWNKNCVRHFIGMFAFAIWDSKKETIFLCRDRMGIKPLYYAWDNSSLFFASELKALVKFTSLHPQIDITSLGEFFQYGYIGGTRTIYKNIYKLSAASWIELNRKDARIISSKYWNAEDFFTKPNLDIPENEIIEKLENIMSDSFKMRLISDVPIGIFLSGGIDSSLLAAILTKKSNKNIKTFTLGFDENKYDESKWAKKIANHLGTDHTEYILAANEANTIIDKLPQMYDEPFGDSSSIPTYMVSRLSREKVTAILSSDGGDELFGGYDYYKTIKSLEQNLMRFPVFLRQILQKSITNLLPSKTSKLSNLLYSEKAKKLIRNFRQLSMILQKNSNQYNLFSTMRSYWLFSDVKNLLGNYSDPRQNLNNYTPQKSFEENMMFWDLKNYMIDNILVKMDRSSMAVSLEGREPFLDHRIIEFALQIPLKYKIGSYGNKHILKKILYKYVPQEFIDRPKQGFSIPIEAWRTQSVGKKIKEDISDFILSNSCDLLNKKQVFRELKFYSSSTGNEHQIWLLYSFVKWYNAWIKK